MRLRGLGPCCAVWALLSCGPGAEPLAPVRSRAPLAAAAPNSTSALPSLAATEVAVVPQGTFGPYVGRDGEQALLVWAAEESRELRAWFALPVAASGEPRGKPLRLASAASDIGVVAVRGLGGGTFALISTRRTATGEMVEAAFVAADGKLLGGPRRIFESAAPVLWVDAASVGSRRLALWATKSEAGADVYAVSMSAKGDSPGEVIKVATGVRAWQVASLPDTLALGVVRGGRERATSGPVEVLWLGADAQTKQSTTTVSPESSADLDLDLTTVGERLIAVWSDRRFGESRLMSAALGRDGSIAVPAGPFTAPLGEQALVRLVGGGQEGYAIWEDTGASDDHGRTFEIARFGADARAGAQRARLHYAALDGSVPEVAKSAGGVAFLTLANACRQGQPCTEDEATPAFLELSPALEVRAFEPLRLAPLGGAVPDLAWGLSCGSERCFALGAPSQSPARVYLAQLESETIGWQLPAERVGDEPAPRVVKSEVVLNTRALAALALGGDAADGLLAWLTDFDPTTPWVRLKTPTEDGRFDPLRSTLAVAKLPSNGLPLTESAATTLSLRAHSLAGIAIAPGRADRRESLVAWAGFDAGQPQVFLSSLGPAAEKREQRMLTRKKGGVSDVNLAPVADGSVLGWIDERSGRPELYAAKVNPALNRVGAEQRISRPAAAPAELVLGALGGDVFAVWSDASGSGQDGRADLYGRLLGGRDAAARGKELRLAETPLHSFSPAVCARGAELVLGWLERADGEQAGHALMLGVLDATGAWKQTPERIPIAQGTPSALALDCSSGVPRAALLVDGGERVELVVFERGAGKLGEPRSVLRLPAGSRSTVAPVLRGDAVFVAEATAGERTRVRRVTIAWR